MNASFKPHHFLPSERLESCECNDDDELSLLPNDEGI